MEDGVAKITKISIRKLGGRRVRRNVTRKTIMEFLDGITCVAPPGQDATGLEAESPGRKVAQQGKGFLKLFNHFQHPAVVIIIGHFKRFCTVLVIV